MSESIDLEFRLRTAMVIANELKKELRNKEDLLDEVTGQLESVRDVVTELVRKLKESKEPRDEDDMLTETSSTSSEPLSESVRDIPACEALIEQFKLSADIYADLHEYFREVDHTEWYWKLMDGSLLSHERAYAMAVAMHIDTNLQFDEDVCLETPYSPWSPQ